MGSPGFPHPHGALHTVLRSFCECGWTFARARPAASVVSTETLKVEQKLWFLSWVEQLNEGLFNGSEFLILFSSCLLFRLNLIHF